MRTRNRTLLRLSELKAPLYAFVNSYKSTIGCKCGEKRAHCLQFHHIDKKTSAIADMISARRSMDEIKAEMNKCRVVCVNCHRIEHYKPPVIHSNRPGQSVTLKIVNQYKASGCCICGMGDLRCLDCHHTDEKTEGISRLQRFGRERLLQELPKTIVVCANCHFDLHHAEKGTHKIENVPTESDMEPNQAR